jgi:hypothetical protein
VRKENDDDDLEDSEDEVDISSALIAKQEEDA